MFDDSDDKGLEALFGSLDTEDGLLPEEHASSSDPPHDLLSLMTFDDAIFNDLFLFM